MARQFRAHEPPSSQRHRRMKSTDGIALASTFRGFLLADDPDLDAPVAALATAPLGATFGGGGGLSLRRRFGICFAAAELLMVPNANVYSQNK